MNEDMERRAERLRAEFPPPRFRVDLVANESEIWVVNQDTHAVAELGEHDFELDPEGTRELEYVHQIVG